MGNGLYANIHKRRKAGKKMRNKGDKGAPTDAAFVAAAKTAKPKKKEPAQERAMNLGDLEPAQKPA